MLRRNRCCYDRLPAMESATTGSSLLAGGDSDYHTEAVGVSHNQTHPDLSRFRPWRRAALRAVGLGAGVDHRVVRYRYTGGQRHGRAGRLFDVAVYGPGIAGSIV